MAGRYQAAGFQFSYEELQRLSLTVCKFYNMPDKEIKALPEFEICGSLTILVHIQQIIDDEAVPAVFIPFYDETRRDPWTCKAGGLMIVRIEPMNEYGKFPEMVYDPNGPEKDVVKFLAKFGFDKEGTLDRWATCNASELIGIDGYVV